MSTPEPAEAKPVSPKGATPDSGHDRQPAAGNKPQHRGRSSKPSAAASDSAGAKGRKSGRGRAGKSKGKEPLRNGTSGGTSAKKNESNGASNDSGDDDSDDEDICFICADPVVFYAVGECDHRTCHLCNLRLRALFKSKACPYCKTDIERVIYTRDADASYAELSKQSFQHHDKNLGIDFDCKEAYDATMYALQFNCPQRKCRYVDYEGWKGLKEHVRSEHSLMFCDLCLKNKKSFAHEHKLFTKSQLRTHYSRGDSTGFPGHPECEFCRTSFYDNDQLFDHCRKKHEQCFICVRSDTGRQVYFANYQSLEEHFNSDHFPCRHASCLEKKFVVFEDDIDLQGHELETHGSSIVGQRAKREARQVNLNFQYSTNRGGSSSMSSGGGTSSTSSRHKPAASTRRPSTMTVNEPDDTGVSIAGRRRPAGFGHVSNEDSHLSARLGAMQIDEPSSAEPSSPEPEPESLWPTLGSESNLQTPSHMEAGSLRGPVRDRAPTSFGRLSDSRASTPPTSSRTQQQQQVSKETLASHQELLQRVSAYLSHREQPVARFRQLTTQYKDGQVSAADYVQNCWLLFLTVPGKNAKEMIQKTVKSVASLLPDSKQTDSLLKALSEHRIKQQQFPALTPLTGSSKKAGTSSGGSARVLVIKQSASSTSHGGWASQKTTASPSRSASSLLAPDIRKSSSSASLAMPGFPSLGSSSSTASLSSAASLHNNIGSRSNSSSGRQQSYSGKVNQSIALSAPARPASQGSKSDFPDLPPSAPAKRRFEPVSSGSPSAWAGSLSQTTSSSGKKSQNKPSRSSKGKQVLFHVG